MEVIYENPVAVIPILAEVQDTDWIGFFEIHFWFHNVSAAGNLSIFSQ